MGQEPRQLAPTESAKQFFGAELRYWRETRQLSQSRLGDLTHHSRSLIGKVEKAERWPSLDLAQRADIALATGGALQRLWPSVEREYRQPTISAAAHDEPDPGGQPPADLGLRWPTSATATVETVGGLWRADMRRRSVLVGAGWAASAVATATRAWFSGRSDQQVVHIGGRRVGKADVEAVWLVCQAFTDIDHHLGGGHGRSTVVHYANDVVLPLLEGSYEDVIGRELMTAAGRLCDLIGFMAFDSGRQGLAQRYFTQALRLAHAGRSRALGAHVLGDMSMQAAHLGRPTEALALAEAGERAARAAGSYASSARCQSLAARAHAAMGDASACVRAMAPAEVALSRSRVSDEPTWIRFFTPNQLAAEFLYAAAELDHIDHVRRLASKVISPTDGMVRRHVLTSVVLASTYVSADEKTCTTDDIDQSCSILGEVLPVAGSLTSARTLDAINRVRRRLTPFAARPAVQDLEQQFANAFETAV